MTKEQQMVREFHEKFGCPHPDRPAWLRPGAVFIRVDVIQEELAEYAEAAVNGTGIDIADALGDMLYAVYGAAVAHGIDLEPIFAEIHRSNLTKLWPDGKPRCRKDGKFERPDTYEPPNLSPLLQAQMRKGGL